MKITMVFAENWQGIYADSRLIYESRSIDAIDMLSVLSNVFNIDHDYVNNYALSGPLPTNLNELNRGGG